MAKENRVQLHGYATCDARVKLDAAQDPIRAMLYVRCVDRTYDNDGIEDVQYTTIFVYSGNDKIIEEMCKVKEGDLVDVYGTLTTAKVAKRRKCPVCGSINATVGDVTYVSPLYVCRREQGLTEMERLEYLKKRKEISNRITVIGNICAGLEYNDGNGTGTPKFRYQLAVPRTVRVEDDTANIITDYPWVLATGNQAVEGKDILQVSSVVYINGHLRSRDQTKTVMCEKCNCAFESQDFPLIRISPHETEYLRRCNVPGGDQ